MPKNIELEDGIYSLKWKEKEYTMYSASLKTIRTFKKAIEDKSENEIDLMIKFLDECGVPSDVVSDMPINVVQKLFEIASGAEKKS